jgi:hypothetical protein
MRVAEPGRANERAVMLQPAAVETAKTGFGHQLLWRIELLDPAAKSISMTRARSGVPQQRHWRRFQPAVIQQQPVI